MKRTVILFITLFLYLSSYGQSLRVIRDSLEAHYGFASVQSNDYGIWFLVGVPGEAEAQAEKYKNAYLLLHSGKPGAWIRPGHLLNASYKLGVCDISGKEIIAPGNLKEQSVGWLLDDFFTLEDGTMIDFDGTVIAQPDKESLKILEEYLKDINDKLISSYEDNYSSRKFIGRKADTLTVYSVKGEILSQIIDSSAVDFRKGRGVVSLKYDSGEVAFFDYYGREIFPKGKYDEVSKCWYGYSVHKKGYGFGVVSFNGKELIAGRPGRISSYCGCLAEKDSWGRLFTNYYRFDGSFICNSEAIMYSDGSVGGIEFGSCCTVLRNIGGTRHAIIDSFGDYILPYTEAYGVYYNEKLHMYEMDIQNSLGNMKKISLGINQFGRVIASPEEINKFGYHLLNGVLGFAGGLAIVATAGTALIGGIAPDISYPVDYNSQYVQSDTYSGVDTAQRTISSQTAPKDGITGSDFQNYERSYDGYAGILSKMYYGQYLYSNSERGSIQREMRNIREKVNSQNQRRKIAQSSWETWNGLSKYLKN